MQSKNCGGMVLALFFGSGAMALIYEVVWAKFLAQMFGSTIYAQTVVLAVFMGELALGLVALVIALRRSWRAGVLTTMAVC